MTLEECPDNSKMENTVLQKTAGSLLVKILKKAITEDRSGNRNYQVITGMYGAAQSLGRNAQNVKMCILPHTHYNSDVAHHINQMLMEAFCHENNISIFKVDCEQKLADFFLNNDSRSGEDFSCVLIQSKNEARTCDENRLIQLSQQHGMGAQFIIELPGP